MRRISCQKAFGTASVSCERCGKVHTAEAYTTIETDLSLNLALLTFQQASNMAKACCANKPKPKSDRMRWRETWNQKWGAVWQLVWKGRVVSEVKKDQRGDWALWINYGALSDDAPADYEMHRANGCDEAKGMARKAVRDFLRSLNEQKASGQ